MAYTEMQLIRMLRSPHKKVVVQAVEELRARQLLGSGALKGAWLPQVNLQAVDLYRANLQSANMTMADLREADLSMADLRDARLKGANLHRADLSKADLQGADLFKANLQGARNLTDAQLAQAERLWGATLPDGSRYDGRYVLAADIAFARAGRVNVDDAQAMAAFYGVHLEDYLKGQEWVKEHLLIVVAARHASERIERSDTA